MKNDPNDNIAKLNNEVCILFNKHKVNRLEGLVCLIEMTLATAKKMEMRCIDFFRYQYKGDYKMLNDVDMIINLKNILNVTRKDETSKYSFFDVKYKIIFHKQYKNNQIFPYEMAFRTRQERDEMFDIVYTNFCELRKRENAIIAPNNLKN